MRIKAVKIENFRGYKEETSVDFDNLTAFVGKNDIGKSTILEALDIFFNDGKGCVKLDKDDICKPSSKEEQDEERDIKISVVFDDLPDEVVIDDSYPTNLSSEYLLNKDGLLEVVKEYHNAGKAKVYLWANHPQGECVRDLLSKKQTELKKMVKELSLNSDTRINSEMRHAIWEHYEDSLQVGECKVDISKEDAKAIWTKLQTFLPVYSLFQSDRSNNDGDGEIQDPLRESVKQILNDDEVKNSLDAVYQKVAASLKDVAARTVAKMAEMDGNLSETINPRIPSAEDLKWADVFKNVSITGENSIPMNKRGSGVRRLILLNFFRAEAESREKSSVNAGIIYAIEEPETSQHAANQRLLAEAFKRLSESDNTQVVLTTHSATMVKALTYDDIRIVEESESGKKEISRIETRILGSPSLNEVNYLAFGEVTEEFHNELFGYLHERVKAKRNDVGGIRKMDDWLSQQSGVPRVDSKHVNEYLGHKDATMPAYIRNYIDHPEEKVDANGNICREKPTSEDIRESIEFMVKLVKNQQSI